MFGVNYYLMIRHRQEAQGWVLRPASADRGKFLSAESSMSALTTRGKCVWAPPLNLVPDLLIVLGATTSSGFPFAR